MAAISYAGHPGVLHRTIVDNHERWARTKSIEEYIERVRAHCEFVTTAVEIRQVIVARIEERVERLRANCELRTAAIEVRQAVLGRIDKQIQRALKQPN